MAYFAGGSYVPAVGNTSLNIPSLSAPSTTSSNGNTNPAFQMEMKAVIQGDGVVTNLEFHEQGQYLAMTTSESAIQLIDCFSGQEKKKIYAKSLGISKLQYTHHDQSLLLGTDHRSNFDIKYLSIYDNRYLRTFRGHSNDVTSLSMSPISDTFLSASRDGSVCMWDLNNRSTNPTAKLQLPGNYASPLCTFDTSGVVFGILCQDMKARHSVLKLYDARAFDSGPFDNIFPNKETIQTALLQTANANPNYAINIQHQKMKLMNATWTNFQFSADGGKTVLINTNSDAILLLDGFLATTTPKILLGRKNDANISVGATFSADARYVLTGNEDNDVLVYDKSTGELLQSFTGHVAPVGVINCNKVYNIIATGCVNTALWMRSNLK